MSKEERNESASEQEQDYTTVQIPSHLVEQVVAYVAELTGDDADVAGYIHSLGGVINLPTSTGPTYPPTSGPGETIFDPNGPGTSAGQPKGTVIPE